jgi:CrcB protein
VIWFGVAFAGALGAVARFETDRAVQRRWTHRFPLGTFVVNISGCLALGVLVGLVDHAQVGPGWRDVVGAGLLGAFTTFSTFGYETVRLIEVDDRRAAVANVVISVVVGLAAAALGRGLAALV